MKRVLLFFVVCQLSASWVITYTRQYTQENGRIISRFIWLSRNDKGEAFSEGIFLSGVRSRERIVGYEIQQFKLAYPGTKIAKMEVKGDESRITEIVFHLYPARR